MLWVFFFFVIYGKVVVKLKQVSYFKNIIYWVWRDDSVFKNTCYFYKGPEFVPSTHIVVYKPPVTPVLEDLDPLFGGHCTHVLHLNTYKQNAHTQNTNK